MTLISILGWIQTILFSIVLIPQIIKTAHIKKVDEISIWVFVISLVANAVALWYAVLISQPPLIFKYISGGLLCGIYIILFCYYQNRKSNSPVSNQNKSLTGYLRTDESSDKTMTVIFLYKKRYKKFHMENSPKVRLTVEKI